MLIAEKCVLKLSVRDLGDYLTRWVYTPQRPTRRDYERDEANDREWLQQQYPRIKQWAKREKAEIYWGDQPGCAAMNRARGYAPCAQTPFDPCAGPTLM